MNQNSFLDKTLHAVAAFGRQSLLSEQYALKTGFLQQIDVRLKLVTFLSILVLASFLHTVETLVLLYGISLILATLSRVPILFFIKRVWLFVPLFSGAIALPGILNIVTPGDTLWVVVKLERVYAWGPYHIPEEITVTRQGLLAGAILVSRVATSVSYAVLFTLTTRWSEIFSGMRSLLVPRAFVMTLSMTERYLFVLLRLVQDMYLGRKSRTIGPLPASAERSWIASRIGITFRRTVETGNAVFLAMQSRGFDGEFRAMKRPAPALYDYLLPAAFAAAGAFLLLFERGFFAWQILFSACTK